MKKVLLTGAAMILLASGAAFAKTGPYVGLNAGWGGMDTAKITKTDTQSNKLHHGIAGRVSAGYLFGQDEHFNYGAEVGYTALPQNKYKIDGKDFKYDSHNIDLLAVAKYNINSNVDVFGKAGGAYVTQKTSGSYEKGLQESKSKLLPEVAVGAGYDFKNGLGLNVTYSHIFGSKPTVLDTSSGVTKANVNKVASVNMVTAGISYTF